MKLKPRRGVGGRLTFAPQVTPTAAEEARLNQLHQAFIRKLSGLTEKQRRDLVNVTAARGDVDPFTSAVASQLKAAFEAKDRIDAAQAELAEIKAMGDLDRYLPDHRASVLSRKEDLEKQIGIDTARAIGLREDDLRTARLEAVEHFRQVDAEDAKARAILDATDRLRAEAATKEIEDIARRNLSGERVASGLEPLDGE